VGAALFGGFVGTYLKPLKAEDVARTEIPLSEVLPAPAGGVDTGIRPPEPPHGIGHHIKFPWAPEIKAVAIIPEFEVPTAKAREVLPSLYPRTDVVGTSLWIERLIFDDGLTLADIQPSEDSASACGSWPVPSRSGAHLPRYAGQAAPAVPADTHPGSDRDCRVDDAGDTGGASGRVSFGGRAYYPGAGDEPLRRDCGPHHLLLREAEYRVQLEGTGAGGRHHCHLREITVEKKEIMIPPT